MVWTKYELDIFDVLLKLHNIEIFCFDDLSYSYETNKDNHYYPYPPWHSPSYNYESKPQLSVPASPRYPPPHSYSYVSISATGPQSRLAEQSKQDGYMSFSYVFPTNPTGWDVGRSSSNQVVIKLDMNLKKLHITHFDGEYYVL